jgi:hypothetical protein
MTIVEMLIATAVLAVLLSAVGLTVVRGTGAYRESLTANEVTAKATRMCERVVDELLAADRSTLVLNPPAPFGASSVDYRRGEGVAGGALAVGNPRRLGVRLDAGELDNGLDDDGDGVVDDCCLELTPDTIAAPGQIIGLGNFVREYLEGEIPNGADDNGNGLVDERGLCVTYDDTTRTATVRLTLERLDADGRLVTRTTQASVQIRND